MVTKGALAAYDRRRGPRLDPESLRSENVRYAAVGLLLLLGLLSVVESSDRSPRSAECSWLIR